MKIMKISQFNEDPGYSNQYFKNIDQNLLDQKIIELVYYLEQRLDDFNEDAQSIKDSFSIPDYTCPLIDKVKAANSRIEGYMRDIERHEFENESDEAVMKDIVSDMEWYQSDIDSEMENIREANDTLRQLGKGWYGEYKDIQKEIRELIITLDNFIR